MIGPTALEILAWLLDMALCIAWFTWFISNQQGSCRRSFHLAILVVLVVPVAFGSVRGSIFHFRKKKMIFSRTHRKKLLNSL